MRVSRDHSTGDETTTCHQADVDDPDADMIVPLSSNEIRRFLVKLAQGGRVGTSRVLLLESDEHRLQC